MNGTWMWVVAAIVVIAIIAAVLIAHSRKRTSASHRSEAADLRDGSADHAMVLREREASAAAAEAQARGAHAEADKHEAEAQQLEVDAQRKNEGLDAAQHTHDEQLRKADALDPDLETDRDGYRVDADGNRQDGDGDVDDAAVDEPTTSTRPTASTR